MDSKEEPTQETDSLIQDEEPQLIQLRGHKHECAIAFVLCFGLALGDLIRWILLLVFRDKMWAFYYENRRLQGIIVGSISWDFVCFFGCAIIYHLHKQWIQLAEYRRSYRFVILFVAISSRLFMMIPMVFGCVRSSRSLQGFVFIVQIVYYFVIVLAWIQPTFAYGTALLYSQLIPLQGRDRDREMEEVEQPMQPPQPTQPPQPIQPIQSQQKQEPMPRTPRPQFQPNQPIPAPTLLQLQHQHQEKHQEKQPLIPPVSLYDSEVDITSVTPAYLTPPSSETESQFL